MIETKSQTRKAISEIKTKKNSYWMKERERVSLDLFHRAANNIYAYKDFLKKNNIKPNSIQTWKDFQTVPVISKKNYLNYYPLDRLCWDNTLHKPLVYTSTSGSTGTPFYFVRDKILDWRCSVFMNLFLENSLEKNKSTLVIVCFGMGIWIGGLITYKAFEIIAQENGYPISIITPGISKREIYSALKNLAPLYDQVVLAGYPPFIKDIVDEAPQQNLDLKKLNLKIKFAAESIPERVREYIAKKAGMENFYLDTMSIYGSADMGAMAMEGPLSILIKRLSMKKKKIFNDIFSGIDKTPTLAQFDPHFVNFESINGELLITSDNVLPLIRYSIGDNGGVLSFDEITHKLTNHGVDLIKEAGIRGVDKHMYELPFVYIYERMDLSASFYGLWIYPEWFRGALVTPRLSKYLTGKFTLITKFDEHQNQYLEINLEKKKDQEITPEIESSILRHIMKSLRYHSSEFREIHNSLKDQALPKLQFWNAEDPLHFQPGIKQKWVKN